MSRKPDESNEGTDHSIETIPREDWPALLTVSVVVLLANVAAYSIRGSVNLPGRSLMYMTIFAVPVGLVAAAAVNYALYGDPLLQLHNRS